MALMVFSLRIAPVAVVVVVETGLDEGTEVEAFDVLELDTEVAGIVEDEITVELFFEQLVVDTRQPSKRTAESKIWVNLIIVIVTSNVTLHIPNLSPLRYLHTNDILNTSVNTPPTEYMDFQLFRMVSRYYSKFFWPVNIVI